MDSPSKLESVQLDHLALASASLDADAEYSDSLRKEIESKKAEIVRSFPLLGLTGSSQGKCFASSYSVKSHVPKRAAHLG